METIATGNPNRWVAGAIRIAGTGAAQNISIASALLDPTGTQTPVGKTFWLTKALVDAFDSAAGVDAWASFRLQDGKGLDRVITQVAIRRATADTGQPSYGKVVDPSSGPAIPFPPSDNTHADQVKFVSDATGGLFAATSFVNITLFGFWTDTPPQDFPVSGPIT